MSALPKCHRCCTHHEADDKARCDNAYEIGVKLRRSINVKAVEPEQPQVIDLMEMLKRSLKP